MSKAKVVSGLVISSCLIVLAGCTSKPTTGDLMRQHATDVQAQADLKNQLSKDWEKGTKLVATGEKRAKDGETRVKAAERELKRGQDDIERGKREIAEGQKLINESENKFQEIFPDLNLRK